MAGTRLTGVAASEGVAVGPVFVHVARKIKPERESITENEVEGELERFTEAVGATVARLSETAEKIREGGSENEAGIFEAHAEIAEDPEFHSEVEERVRGLTSPEAAVISVGEEFAGMFAAMDDEYMAARADDVRDVAAQIASELMGGGPSGLESLAEPSVILASNLAPSDTARIPPGMALGFVVAGGSRTSHVSIMARSFGIPAVVGVGDDLEDAFDAGVVAIDGTEGYAVADPEEDVISDFEQKGRDAAAEAEALEEYKHAEARTGDGRRIEVAANIGSAEEAEGAISFGAEGVGLFRTEFLFMKRPDLPSEEEQYEAYRRVAEEFGERPVIIRTIDVGGDKDLPGVDQPEEENPFLGWRGIRMCLDVPELAFFSIGTNDLVQYTLAADRGNERLTRLQSADHPAVLDLIGKTCEAAKEAGIWVGVCGEAAGEPDLIPRLVELGVTELSMSAPSIPKAKKIASEL